MAVLASSGQLVSVTPAAARLLRRFELPVESPATLPANLARELASAPLGEAIIWRHPSADHGAVLGCTRYSLGSEHLLLLMREITEQQRALSQQLHRQRLEATGRLISHIAHDLRAPLSSIIYNVDLLAKRSGFEELQNIQIAADALRDTIAGLLDFVRLGPPAVSIQTIGRLFERISSLLRPAFRHGKHELSIALHDDGACVRGNSIAIEQIFLNLIINATESRSESVRVRIASEQVGRMVIVRVSDDGPGIPLDRRDAVFDEFVTSKPHGTGLGLTVAREAAVALGGSLMLEPTAIGCCFAVALPLVGGELA
ncbi:MAG TPA: HAMP domain-containing sensor histidine kinase [Kofleriaceae bacterium]